jgi:hypothetical protein
MRWHACYFTGGPMRLAKLCSGLAIVCIVALAGCGGSSSTPAPATPGALQIAYTSSFGASSPASSTPAAIVFGAETQTVSVTASQSNNSTGYSAAAGTACGTAVTVTPATSASGSFTITAANAIAASANCTIVFTGATGTSTVSVGASVPAPGGVVMSWVANAAYATQPAPITPLAGPINLIGVGTTFGAVLVVSETHYVSTFGTPVVTCGTNLAALTAATQGNIAGPSAALGQTQVYYNVAAAAAAVGFAPAACTITVTDNQPTPSTGTIGVSLTTTGGGIN